MAILRGQAGDIRVPSAAAGNFSSMSFTEIGTNRFAVSVLTTRQARAFTEDAVVADFVITPTVGSTTNPDSLNIGTGDFDWNDSGTTGPWTVVSYNSRVYTLATLASFFNWTLQTNRVIQEIDAFQSDWTEAIALTKGWSATAEAYFVDNQLTVDAAAGKYDIEDGPFAVSFFLRSDPTNSIWKRFSGLAHISGVDVTADVGDVIRKTITFQGEEDLFYRSDS